MTKWLKLLPVSREEQEHLDTTLVFWLFDIFWLFDSWEIRNPKNYEHRIIMNNHTHFRDNPVILSKHVIQWWSISCYCTQIIPTKRKLPFKAKPKTIPRTYPSFFSPTPEQVLFPNITQSPTRTIYIYKDNSLNLACTNMQKNNTAIVSLLIYVI